jgi:hypothetical protein
MPSLYTDVIHPLAQLSVLVSAAIPLTVCVFPQMIKCKIFMEIILYISLSDILDNWPYTMGYYPANRTSLCSFEGFCNLLFFPCSWMYSSMLTLCLCSLVFYNKVVITRAVIHGVSIGIPLVFTLFVHVNNYWGIEPQGKYRVMSCAVCCWC